MTVQTDKVSIPSSWERAQHLYEKIIELENQRRKSAQARVPSDPNAWQQIRENYEAIILEDHAFSEKHNIEYALWQLHYRRIEEFRAHFSATLASNGSSSSHGGKGPPRPDRILRIRQQFKTFLSEATGFYHDLIMRIRAKYGLPLSFLSDNSESCNVVEKDGNKSIEIKKALITCHRCLIYLGDLARYKGLYGEGQSRNREYAAANSYYLEAAPLWPSSGNPHHQLAILASYSGDELVAVYRYFRSLAVENPFSTARDNLMVAFEKNRQSHSQLPGKIKAAAVKELHDEVEGGKTSKDTSSHPNIAKESISTIRDMFKSFCIQFIRLNGILFTRTSLDTFGDILSSTSSCLRELLSSGPVEELNFGADAIENRLLFVRVVAILIYTVYNAKRETEGQSYAEIVQRAAVLQNSFTATFEIMGHVFQRCAELQDPSSSYLLPGILVFVEWLACFPDILTGIEVNEKQAFARSNFWNHYVCLLNKILSVEPMSINDNEDESCFGNLARYEEGETENRLALSEDFELRGFLPLLPAQTILSFARKHSFGGDGDREKKARMKRILSAAKALTNIFTVDGKTVHFDSKLKKFVIGAETHNSHDCVQTQTDLTLDSAVAQSVMTSALLQPNPRFPTEVEEEEEVIVFKPSVAERHVDVHGLDLTYNKNVDHGQKGQTVLTSGLHSHVTSSSQNNDNVLQPAVFREGTQNSSFVSDIPIPQVSQLHTSSYIVGEEHSLVNGLDRMKLIANGHGVKPMMQESLGNLAASLPFSQSLVVDTSHLFNGQMKSFEALAPSNMNVIPSSAVGIDSLSAKTSTSSQAGLKKNPVNRPLRHIGPPPGFSPVPSRQANGPISAADICSKMPIADNYSRLDGFELRAPMKPSGANISFNHPPGFSPQHVSNSNGSTGNVSFPFPGKHVVLNGVEHAEYSKLGREQQIQKHQQGMVGNQQMMQFPEQYQGQFGWTGGYHV